MTDPYEAIYGRDNPRDGAHGWIQWKGTSVCIDTHCECGHHGHVDAEFFYAYRCPCCGRRYAVGQVVKLIPLETPEQVARFDDYETDECDDEDEDDQPAPHEHEPRAASTPAGERTLPSGIIVIEKGSTR